MARHYPKYLHPRRLLRWLLILLASLVILLVGLSLIVALTINTETGRLWLSKQAIAVVNRGKTMHLEVRGLRSPELGKWRAKSIVLCDADQPWLELHQPQLRWRPYFLLHKQLLIDELAAAAFVLRQRPAESSPPEPDQGPVALPFFELIELQRLQLKAIRLEGFGGIEPGAEQLNLSLDGRASWHRDNTISLQLLAATLSAIPAQLELQLDSADWSTFQVAGELREPAGGSIGRRLKLPAAQAIDARINTSLQFAQQILAANIAELSFPLVDNQIDLTADLQYATDSGDLRLQRLRLKINDTEHLLAGKLVAGQLDFALQINQLPLSIARIWLQPLSSGQLSARLQLRGSLEQPIISGTAAAEARYNDLPLALDVAGSASLSNASFTSINATLAGASASGQGRIDWQSRQTELEFAGRNFDLQSLRQFNVSLPSELELILERFSGRLTGAVQNPNGVLQLSGSGRYRQQQFSLSSELGKRQSTLSTKAAQLTLGEASGLLAGSFDYSSLEADLTLAAKDLPLQLLQLAGLQLPAELEATAKANLSLKGPVQRPRIDGEASVVGLYQQIPFTVAAKGMYSEALSRLDTLELSIREQPTLSVNLAYAREEITLQLDSVRLNTDQLPLIDWPLPQGTLQASVNLQGKLDNPELQASVNYDTNIQGYDEESEPISLPLQWDVIAVNSAGMLQLDSQFTLGNKPPEPLSLTLATTPLLQNLFKLEGAQPYTSLPLTATLAGQLNLQTLAAFIPDNSQSIAGKLSTNLALTGTLLEPVINGSLDLKNASYANFSTGTSIEKARCTIETANQNLELKNCDATDGLNGKLVLSGQAQLPGGDSTREINLTLKAERAALLRNPQIESELTGTINLSGNYQALLASGEMAVSPFTAVLSSGLGHQIPTIKVEDLEAEGSEADAKQALLQLPVVTLDLVLSARNQAYLRGRGLEAELQGKLKLRGTVSAPRYDGAFKTVRGSFKVFGKKFNLDSGEVNLANDAIGLAIQGTYSKSGRVIVAKISGTGEDLKITFSSTPAMPEDEIVSYIVFGKSVQSMSPIEAVQLAAAINTLRSGGSGFDPIDSTRELLGADTLFIETESAEGDSEGVSVGVGKYVNEKVYLELERTPNPSQPWKGRVEIELSPNLNLESSTGGKTGIEGAELKWKKNY